MIDSEEVRNVRAVLAGKNPEANDYQNVNVVETVNSLGTYYSLQVVNGARPSQLSGRNPVKIVINQVITSSLLYTITP